MYYFGKCEATSKKTSRKYLAVLCQVTEIPETKDKSWSLLYPKILAWCLAHRSSSPVWLHGSEGRLEGRAGLWVPENGEAEEIGLPCSFSFTLNPFLLRLSQVIHWIHKGFKRIFKLYLHLKEQLMNLREFPAEEKDLCLGQGPYL